MKKSRFIIIWLEKIEVFFFQKIEVFFLKKIEVFFLPIDPYKGLILLQKFIGRSGSGTEHGAHMIAVEVRHGTLSTHYRSWWHEEDRRTQRRRRGGEEKTTHIKSNSPHLPGGEKKAPLHPAWQARRFQQHLELAWHAMPVRFLRGRRETWLAGDRSIHCHDVSKQLLACVVPCRPGIVEWLDLITNEAVVIQFILSWCLHCIPFLFARDRFIMHNGAKVPTGV